MRPFLMLILVLCTIVACDEQEPDYPTRQLPHGLHDDPAQIKKGEAIFKAKCASCHGKPSEGRSGRAAFFEPPAPDFTEERYRTVSPAYLYWRIEVGKTVEPYLSRGSVMPAWGSLPEREIWQLVVYLQARAR